MDQFTSIESFTIKKKKKDRITAETDEESIEAFENTVAHVAAHMHAS
jgi:hypothetical protein